MYPGDKVENRDIGGYLITICILTAFSILLVILVMVLICIIRQQRRKTALPKLISRTPYCGEVKFRPKSTNLELQGGCPLPPKHTKCETNKALMSDIQYVRHSLAVDDSGTEKVQKDNYVCISAEKDSNLAKQV